MSAIAGIWHPDYRHAADAVSRMQRAQEMYGPDRADTWNGGDVVLGSRLMRLLPEDRFDRQPLVGRGGRLVLVADVRLDNREDLGRLLSIDTSRLATLCDAAMLLAAFERWGEATVEHLEGSFAFAAWDADARRLILARDHRGSRPLHYHMGDGWVAFASMPKGLLALPDLPRGADDRSMQELLLLLPIQDGRSFWTGIKRVEQGQQIVLPEPGRAIGRTYWRPGDMPMLRFKRDADYAEGLREVFDRAVACRLRSVGKVGSLLSSGLDSTAVTVTAAEMLAARGERLTAYTSVPRPGFTGKVSPGALADEGPLAALTAAGHPNIDHRIVSSEAGQLLPTIARFASAADHPVVNPCNQIWFNLITDSARKDGIRALLPGDMGNNTISYRGLPALSELLSQGNLLGWFHTASSLVRRGTVAPHQLLWPTVGPWIPEWLAILVLKARGRYKAPDETGKPVTLDLHNQAWVRALLASAGIAGRVRPPRNSRFDRIRRLTRRDKGCYLAGFKALGGYDFRDPMDDRRLIDYCLSVPASQYLAGGQMKSLYRRALGDRVPDAILNATHRGAQSSDWRDIMWLERAEIRAEIERQAENPTVADCLDVPELLRLAHELDVAGPDRLPLNILDKEKLFRGLAAGQFICRAEGRN
jgi:asparagine synthase (glutamine-hydrolysing)